MGVKSLDYLHRDPSDELIQLVIRVENDRASKEQAALDAMAAAAAGKTGAEKEAADKAVADRKATNLHVPRELKFGQSWNKRHQEHLALYHCADCHKSRREKGVDFEEDESYVRHSISCDICKKPMNWIDFPEDVPADRQAEQVSRERHLHPGACTEKHDEIIRIIRETEKTKAAGGTT